VTVEAMAYGGGGGQRAGDDGARVDAAGRGRRRGGEHQPVLLHEPADAHGPHSYSSARRALAILRF
jgi:hypothetical protein